MMPQSDSKVGALQEKASDVIVNLTHLHDRMKNPHLRAKMAEVLEAVMPHMEPVTPGATQTMFQRERVFCAYRHAAQLAEALIAVFVDIEFTGESW